MFVSDNTLKSAKNYFYDRLDSRFSNTELKSMWIQLICKRMNWSSSDLLLNQGERLSESDLLYVRSFVKGLMNDVPFQYLVGETDFYGLSISCDSRALIPRPETEELVSWIIETKTHPKRIIDCCTGTAGSGCEPSGPGAGSITDRVHSGQLRRRGEYPQASYRFADWQWCCFCTCGRPRSTCSARRAGGVGRHGRAFQSGQRHCGCADQHHHHP